MSLEERFVEANVCNDCAMFWANAELPDYDHNMPVEEYEERVEEIRNGKKVDLDCDDLCIGFSTKPCESCGSWLAGERHRAWIDTKDEYA